MHINIIRRHGVGDGERGTIRSQTAMKFVLSVGTVWFLITDQSSINTHTVLTALELIPLTRPLVFMHQSSYSIISHRISFQIRSSENQQKRRTESVSSIRTARRRLNETGCGGQSACVNTIADKANHSARCAIVSTSIASVASLTSLTDEKIALFGQQLTKLWSYN